MAFERRDVLASRIWNMIGRVSSVRDSWLCADRLDVGIACSSGASRGSEVMGCGAATEDGICFGLGFKNKMVIQTGWTAVGLTVVSALYYSFIG